MRSKKLSWKEIEQAVNKIRQKYDDFIIQYLQPFTVKEAFEERYIEAIRVRKDMSSFLKLEISILYDLTQKEEGRKAVNRRISEKAMAARSREESGENFAERIIREHKEMIDKYPSEHIHNRASGEIRKLFGVLIRFEKDFWPDAERFFREIYPSRFSGPREAFESGIISLCVKNSDGIPPVLCKYYSLFLRNSSDNKVIEFEEKRYMIESALLLHRIRDELTQILGIKWFDNDKKERIQEILDFIDPVIKDFRLGEFKPGKIKGV